MAGGRHTKYEAQLADSYYDQALSPRRNVISRIVTALVEQAAQLIFDFQTEPEIVRVRDVMGSWTTVEYRGAELRGDYKFALSLDSMRNKGQEQRLSEANMVLSQLTPFAQGGFVDPRSLVRQYLTRLNSDWDIDMLVAPSGPQGAPPQPFNQYQQSFQRPPGAPPPGLPQLLQQMGSSGANIPNRAPQPALPGAK
jgi:hypothetical protein